MPRHCRTIIVCHKTPEGSENFQVFIRETLMEYVVHNLLMFIKGFCGQADENLAMDSDRMSLELFTRITKKRTDF